MAVAPTPTPAAAPPITVSARQLYADYSANEVSADEKYKGRSLLVTGSITSIDKDAFDDMVLRLASGDALGVDDVMATLDDSQKRTAMGLSKGKQATVLCKGTGMTLGSPTLSGCRLQ